MGLENRAPRPVIKKVEPRGPQAPANNDNAWTAEEEAWFKAGEARTQAAEKAAAMDAERRAQVEAYNAREAKLKAAEGKK